MRAAILCLALAAVAGCASVPPAIAPVAGASFAGQLPVNPQMSARAIVEAAHAAAGGDVWVNPRSLHLVGEAVFFTPAGPVRHERYEMWRVYPDAKAAAHAADGKVRIQSWRDGQTALLLAFDGERSYTAAGLQPPSDADRQWSENFGFGVIRSSLDDGFTLTRGPDDLVDGRPAHVITVTDPARGATVFAIDAATYAVTRVGFMTPRGWHERTYSDFYTVPGSPWVQPGRIRLTYNGIKQNEIIWRSFTVNPVLDDGLFVVAGP
jgi:hypothetical protein